MSDPIDALLDSLGVADAAPEPPAAFLRAVGRRRVRRRGSQAAAACFVVVAMFGLGILLRPNAPAAPAHDRLLASAPLPATSTLLLTRINLDRDVDHLLLPDHRGAPAEPPLRLGLRWDPSEVERWVGQ